jgi:regulator of replication initiation timing
MTENLLQKLEERMVTLLSEIEDLRNEVQRLTQENFSLKNQSQHSTKKLQDLISLLDAVHVIERPVVMQHANHVARDVQDMESSVATA